MTTRSTSAASYFPATFSTKQELTLVKSESFDTLGEEETVERLRVARDKINKMLEDGAAG